MISTFRRYLSTWVVRIFFLLLVVAFATWGIGDVIRQIGSPSWVAKVGGRTIEAPEVQDAYQRSLAQVERQLPPGQQPTDAQKRVVLTQSLERLIAQIALAQETERLHIAVPDEALRQAVFGMPAFRGANGQFDRATLERVLRSNGLTEARFLDLLRGDLAQRQLLEAVRVGAYAPDVLARQVYDFSAEKRSADVADFPIAAVPAPAPPTDAELHRWYDNHPDSYRTPEFRRIKAIELSPQSLAKDITVSAADLQAAYEQHKADYVTPERRAAEVILAPDQAKAQALAAQWRGGADWPAMQAAATAAGATAVALPDSTEPEYPVPELGRAVFAAAPGTVPDPVHSALGWHVLKVVHVVPGTDKTLDQVRDQLRTRVQADRATDLMYDRANKVDNILGGGASLDELPNDLGLTAIAGTLDKSGMTKDGTPAPIPGAPELRKAIVDAAFAQAKGDPPHLTEVATPSTGGSSYYALSVLDVTPPAAKPYDDVKDQVLADWTQDARRHEAETQAAALLTAVKDGHSFAGAAKAAGVAVTRTPLATRNEPVAGLPDVLQRVLFGLQKGEPGEVATADGFVVAVPAEIVVPDPKTDPLGYDQIRARLTRAMSDDTELAAVQAWRDRAEPRINQANLDSIAQP